MFFKYGFPHLIIDQFMHRSLSDACEASRRLSDAYEPRRRLSDAYEPSHRLSDAYDQNLKKKN